MEERGKGRMMEYKIQMFRAGKWVTGQIPYAGHISIVADSIESARKMVDIAKEKWNNLDRPAHEKPTEWRILSRKVTEWKPEHHA